MNRVRPCECEFVTQIAILKGSIAIRYSAKASARKELRLRWKQDQM